MRTLMRKYTYLTSLREDNAYLPNGYGDVRTVEHIKKTSIDHLHSMGFEM